MREASLGLGFSVPMTARRQASPGLYGARNTSHPNKSVSSMDGAASSYSQNVPSRNRRTLEGRDSRWRQLPRAGLSFEWRTTPPQSDGGFDSQMTVERLQRSGGLSHTGQRAKPAYESVRGLSVDSTLVTVISLAPSPDGFLLRQEMTGVGGGVKHGFEWGQARPWAEKSRNSQ
jgi:hypothetical protein